MTQTPVPFALLICNGEMAAPEVVRQLAERAQIVICADGGANAAHTLRVLPHTIIGDFDSITREVEDDFTRRGVEMQRITRQNDTDFEKALVLLCERGVERVVVLGLTGKLLDHTLGNISIILRFISRMRIVIFDPHFRVDVLTTGGSFRSREGDRVSVVPLPAAKDVSYQGLCYPLDGATLSIGQMEGTCNEACGEGFSIDFTSGTLLLFRQLHPEYYQQPFYD